ncbi:hypothetical protein JKF63_06999 [Porcisia hertigi]|uniref:Uncharacterized protein n=1 Tax=Porcisia hertigi TaxID=2761500 RepID=A0A836IDF2_9TRYP|nr:hypothetical protein JKF63_06999 [Porcisia hertigi]
MRRSCDYTPRDAQRGSHSAHTQLRHGNATDSSRVTTPAASLNGWVSSRLLDSTVHILTVQPADPLRVLSVRFYSEALLIAAYPTTAAPTGGKELGAEAEQEASRVVRAMPPSGTAKGTALNGGPAKQKPSLSTDGRGAAVFPVEHLIEQKWVRRYLQPYGLRAVARCACVCPPLRPPPAAPSPFAVSMSPVGSADDLDTANAGTACATSRPLHSQWMDMLVLLHRQSRMSIDELTAEATHRDAQSISAAAILPVDCRAAEEIPTSIVLLCVMVVIEEHLRCSECGEGENGASRPRQLRRRLQTSVKLLGLQLLAAFMDLQHKAENTQRSSDAGASDRWQEEEDVEQHNHNDTNTPAGDAHSCLITRYVYLLSAQELDQLHHWLHCRLEEFITLTPTPLTAARTAVDDGNGDGGGSGEVINPNVRSPLEYLQSRTTAYLTQVLGCPADDMAAPASVQNVMSVDTFVAFMDRLSAVLVAHQHTAVAMSIALSARLPPKSTASAGESRLPPSWVTKLLSRFADALVQPLKILQGAAIPDPTPSTLPLAWRVYANQLLELLSPFQRDLLERYPREPQEENPHPGTFDEGVLGKLQRRLLSWTEEAEHRYGEPQKTNTADSPSSGLSIAEVVSALVSHVFEAYTITLYPN